MTAQIVEQDEVIPPQSGASICSTPAFASLLWGQAPARKRSPLIAPSKTHRAVMPLQHRPATKVVTLAFERGRTILVLPCRLAT